MFNDVVDLWDFYGTPVGQVARRTIRRRIRALWPNVRGETVLGLGYAVPYLRPFRDEAERVIAMMPAQQGVLHWPFEGANRATLVDEADLPLQDVSVDRVLLIHTLECTEQLRAMLDEVWRVLSGNGKLLVVVPNRRGLWARFDRTPFGHGHPYTPYQLSRLLRDNQFTPSRTAHALFAPPTTARVLRRWSTSLEHLGERWFSHFGGVVLIEATKQIYVTRKPAQPVVSRARALLPLPVGRAQGAAARTSPLGVSRRAPLRLVPNRRK